jgi:hypothetical protein
VPIAACDGATLKKRNDYGQKNIVSGLGRLGLLKGEASDYAKTQE